MAAAGTPHDDDPPDAEPDDAELIAYLDGELDEPQARAVEDRLTADPDARAQANAYKKTYDLLDYLPKPEPSPDFATRTITRIQPTLPVSPSGSAPVAIAASARLPALSGSGSAAQVFAPEPPQNSRPWWIGAAAWSVAAVICLLGGYAVRAGLDPIIEPPVKENDDLALADIRVIEALPLYLGVDDLDYVRKLDDPELFAPDLSLPPAPRGEPAPLGHRDKLIELFKSFPPTRQQQLRQLDHQLHELPADEQDRLGRVLETYAVWLDRLPDAERRRVLAAPTPSERISEVRQVKEKLWQEGLSVRLKDQLKLVGDPEDKVGLIERWKQSERTRREEWSLARRQWDAVQGGNRKPWPFTDPDLAAQVEDYVKGVFKVDLTRPEPKFDATSPVRLTRDEYVELKTRHEAATRENQWFLYGVMVYRLSVFHPGLPEPGDKPAVTDYPQANELVRELNGKKGLKLQQEKRLSRNKWPEFALELTDLAKRNNLPHEPLGPCKPGAFAEPVNAFLSDTLQPKLTPNQRDRLKRDEGKWPEYPRTMIELAREHNLPVPGVTLPGPPHQWQEYYSLAPLKKR